MDAAGDWTGDIVFPATKLDLIDAAAAGDAPQPVIDRLQQLEHERYETLEELQEELADEGE